MASPPFHPRDYDKLLIATISCSSLPEISAALWRWETLRVNAEREAGKRWGKQSNNLPKRDCEAVNNLLENIFLCPSHRPTNPP